MAESGMDADTIFIGLLQQSEGEGIEQVANLCDQVFDFLRRNTKYMHNSRCGALIKQKLAARIATAKQDFNNPKQKEDPMKKRMEEASKRQAAEAEAKKRAEEQAKKEAKMDEDVKEQTNEIEELDPATMQPKVQNKKIEVDDDEEDESGDMPNPGNGGSTDNYSWTQTLDEVDLRVEVPVHTKGRHLNVDVGKTKILIGIKGEKPLIDGELEAEITESMWTLESEDGKKYICINMDKRKGMCWWKRVVKGHVGIKTKKIQPENSKLADLEGETRQQVEKMMFDQRQREMGKPTSAELSQRDKLSKFMEMHPEMDFSNAKFSGTSGTGGGFGGMGGFGV